MTQPQFEDRDQAIGMPEVVDDDSPERDRYPEPEEPALPSDTGYPGSGSVGTTVEEQVEGESLDRKLAQERPEPQVDPLRPRADDAARDDVARPGAGEDAGQLVAPDMGASPDVEKDEVARETAGAYDEGPEERAMRVEPGEA